MKCPKCGTDWEKGITVCEVCQLDMTAPRRTTGKKKKRRAAHSSENQGRYMASGIVGIALGGLILGVNVMRGIQIQGGAHGAGQMVGLLMGVLFLGAGGYYVFRAMQ